MEIENEAERAAFDEIVAELQQEQSKEEEEHRVRVNYSTCLCRRL